MYAMRRIVIVAGLLAPLSAFGFRADKPDPASYILKLHVSAAQYDPSGRYEIVSGVVGGKHYQLEASNSGYGLLNPGDYPAKLVSDKHKTSYESLQIYQLLFPDGSVRTFHVILQAE